MSVRRRAQELDNIFGGHNIEETYIRIYIYFSWYIHSDPTATLGFDKDFYNHLVSYAYLYTHDIYVQSIERFCKFFNIDKVLKNFPDMIENFKRSPGYFILELKIRGKISDMKYNQKS